MTGNDCKVSTMNGPGIRTSYLPVLGPKHRDSLHEFKTQKMLWQLQLTPFQSCINVGTFSSQIELNHPSTSMLYFYEVTSAAAHSVHVTCMQRSPGPLLTADENQKYC